MTEPPAGSPLPGTTGTGRPDAVSVAELLARNTAAAEDRGAARHGSAGPITGPVLSVGDLMRREGRADAELPPTDIAAAGTAGGWPDIELPQPRTGAGAADTQQWPVRPATGRRRAGAVAGVLVAAGSVFGAAIYNGASSQDSDAQAAADGLFPGVGLPAAGAPEPLPDQYLPANVALSSQLGELPPTAPGASNWMSVAFPQQQSAEAPSSAAGTLRAVSGGTASGAAAAVPAQRVTSPSAGDDAASPAASGPTGTGSAVGGLAPVQALNNPERSPAGNILDPVTAAGPSSGGTSTGPVQDVTETARPVGGVVGGAVSPVARATAPVGDTVGGAVTPVTDGVRPLTSALQPVTEPVTDTLEPVTTPVLGALSPVTEPVLKGTEPLTGPVLKAAEPVTSLLDTSAKRSGSSNGSGSSDGSDSSDGSGSSSSSDRSGRSGSSDSSGSSGSSSDETQPLQAVTKPVGKTLNSVTEPVGGALGGVTDATGSLLGGN